jgi:hypothetical protein
VRAAKPGPGRTGPLQKAPAVNVELPLGQAGATGPTGPGRPVQIVTITVTKIVTITVTKIVTITARYRASLLGPSESTLGPPCGPCGA